MASAPSVAAAVAGADPALAMSGPAVISEPRDGWPLAPMSGVVMLVDGCLRLGSGDPDQAAVMIWPAGSRWDARHDQMVLPDGRTIAVGAMVEGAAGSFTSASMTEDDEVGSAVLRCVEWSGSVSRFGDVVLIDPVVSHEADRSSETTTTILNAVSSGCQLPLPERLDEFGTVHTIVPASNRDDVDVTLQVSPLSICPTGTVTVTLTVTNVTDHATTFDARGGLVITAGDAAKWNIGALPTIPLAAGEQRSFELDVAIPPALQPSPYWMFADGYRGRTAFTVAAPTDQIPPAPDG